MNKVLVVDDELSIRESFSLILNGKYKVSLAASGEGAIKAVADHSPDLVYLDIRMPGLNGLETLKRIKELNPLVEVIMVTAVNDVQKASEAVRLGARDYVVKPFDVEAIQKLTEQILRRKALLRESQELGRKPAQLIGQSEKITRLLKAVEQIAGQDNRVLILGEPGTEKETVARLIHEKSRRAAWPFGRLNLAGQVSSASINHKLFGQASGGTTADLKKSAGALEAVRGGTLFLDHVEFLPLELVANASLEARLIAGSNLLDLAEKTKPLADYFSEALFVIPPLRERPTDLPLLVNHYLESFGEKYGKEVKELPPEVEECLSNYSWPGNTAELELVLERLVLANRSGKIELADLPLELLLNAAGAPGGELIANFESRYIRQVFEENKQNKELTTRALGVSPLLLNL